MMMSEFLLGILILGVVYMIYLFWCALIKESHEKQTEDKEFNSHVNVVKRKYKRKATKKTTRKKT